MLTPFDRTARLGDARQAVGAGAGAASATISTPAVAAALGLSSSTAALIAGPLIGGIAIALMAWLNRKGPGQKIATTQIVNEAEPILEQNRDAFLSGPKTAADKEFAVFVYNKIWGEVVAACGQSQFGNPGERCIADRQRGGKWDWASYYLDPIINTPTQEDAGFGLNVNIPSFNGLSSMSMHSFGLITGIGLLVVGLMQTSKGKD